MHKNEIRNMDDKRELRNKIEAMERYSKKKNVVVGCKGRNCLTTFICHMHINVCCILGAYWREMETKT